MRVHARPRRSATSIDDATAALQQAARGDRTALAELVAHTQADVWRFCAHLVDVASADDLAQETYLRALGSFERFRGESSARTWLLAIARRACADELRRRVRRRGRERPTDPQALAERESASSVATSAPPPSLGLPADLVAAIDALDEDRRVAFVLTQVLGLSYREAAVAADVPIGTIRSRVARARDDLVAHLDLTSAAGPPHPGRPRTPARRPRRRGA